MPPPPAHRRPTRRASIVSALTALLCVAGCGLPPTTLPAAPDLTPPPSIATPPTRRPGLPPSPLPTASPATARPTTSVSLNTHPTGLPTYPQPTEPACLLPTKVPASLPNAGGPTLSQKRVARAWRASETGKSIGVKTGTLEKGYRGMVTPASVVHVEGARWVALDIREWSSLMTIVLADPGVAAAKLEAVRAMVRHPCSYPFGHSGPYVVASVSDDRPDLVVVTGMMNRYPVTDTFVRYGNTVTYGSMMLVPSRGDDIRTMVLDALTKA